MFVAVMSDSHDNIWNLRKALTIIKKKGAGLTGGRACPD